MSIPFSILRFNDLASDWGIQFVRNDPNNGFWHTWTNIPLNFNGIDLGYTGKLKFAAGDKPKRTKKNYNLLPYVSTRYVNDSNTP
jgi:hypothetical protein